MYLLRFLDVTHWIHIRIHQDTCIWTLHHDTSRYTEIQNHDIQCILDASWCWHGLIVSESQVLQVNELVEMHGSCPPERRERLERMKGDRWRPLQLHDFLCSFDDCDRLNCTWAGWTRHLLGTASPSRVNQSTTNRPTDYSVFAAATAAAARTRARRGVVLERKVVAIVCDATETVTSSTMLKHHRDNP